MRYHTYDELLANNRAWVRERRDEDPEYFRRLASGQDPPFLFIGCSDSRKPPETLTGTEPGELFIHRNIANQFREDDLNARAVLEFAVQVLEVEHVIVCGHHRCGGIDAALGGRAPAAVTQWIAPVREVADAESAELEALADESARADRLAELNAIHQAGHILASPILEEAVRGGRYPRVHAWVFEMETGLLRELELPLDRWKDEGRAPEGYGA